MSAPAPAPLPAVSVVIPCRDAAEFLGEAIDSALAQEGVRVEVVVVDDGSTDGSLEVARGYGSRVRTIALPRSGGPAAARNEGARAATGDALLFLDADDVLGPGTLASLAAALHGRGDALAACPWRRLRRRGGRWEPAAADRPFPVAGADPLRGWLEGAWVPTCALLWGRGAFDASGGWDPEITQNEDGDLAMRALAGGAPLLLAEDGEGFYRTHGAERLTVSGDVFSAPRLRSRARVLEKLEVLLGPRLPAYADAVGMAWHHLAQDAFRGGHPELGRVCLARGRVRAGERAISRTRAGRLLARLVGLERKERLAAALARLGIATAAGRRLRRLRALAEGAR